MYLDKNSGVTRRGAAIGGTERPGRTSRRGWHPLIQLCFCGLQSTLEKRRWQAERVGGSGWRDDS